MKKLPEKEITFVEHLEELRRRLIVSLAVILVFSIVAYFFSERMINYFTRPLPGVYFFAPTEAFTVRIKVSLIAGLIASLPLVFYQLWMFVGPGLLKKEVRAIVPIIVSATVFFLAGGGFCFFYVIPAAVKILLGFGTANLKPMISIDSYVSFAAMMVLAFGLVFELPVAAFILGRLGVIDHRFLAHGRRYAAVIILIAAAILTPTPDAFSQLLLAGPLYFLYEVSIVVLWLTCRKKRAG